MQELIMWIRSAERGRAIPGRVARTAMGIVAALSWSVAGVAGAEVAPALQLLPSGAQALVDLPTPSGDDDLLMALDLELHKSMFLRTDYAVKRISVGDPKILDVVVLSPREIQLVPRRIGATNLIFWNQGGEPSAVVEVSVGTSFSNIERRLRAVLRTDGINVESAGDAVVLTGTVPSPVQVEQASRIAKAFFPKDSERRVVNTLDVGGNQQVMIEIIIAEMSRSLGRRLSVNYDTIIRTGSKVFTFTSFLGDLISLDDEATGVLNVSPGTTDFIGTFISGDDFALSYFIEASVDQGLAKVLAKPTLLARSGQTASFLAGGEVPIPILQGFDSVTVSYKQFGVSVEFTPIVLEPGRIHLDVNPEVSRPDFALGTTAAGFTTPGFITRRASTAIELADGQSFAIAGLLDNRTNEFIDKYPLLGDIPILGALFRSVEFDRQETELVMIVTPRLVKPLVEGLPPLPTDSFVEPSDFEFFLLGALESQRTGNLPEETGGGLIGPAGHRVPIGTEGSIE